MKPLVVVGDVHGNAVALKSLLERLKNLHRIIVFVGDYVNGGLASADVLDQLIALKRLVDHECVFLAGNHDLAFLDYINGGAFSTFAAMGGTSTLASYVGFIRKDVRSAFKAKFPEDHHRFLEDLRPCYEEQDLLVSHVGFCPEKPSDRSKEALAGCGGRAVFTSTPPRDLVVCGHYLQTNKKPYNGKHIICVDTGSGMADGPLTAVLLPEREFISVTVSDECLT